MTSLPRNSVTNSMLLTVRELSLIKSLIKNNSYPFFCAYLHIIPLFHFLFLPLKATERMLKTYRAFLFKQFNSQKKNLAQENIPYFHLPWIHNCLGWGKITISLPQRCKLAGTHKRTLSVLTAPVQPFQKIHLTRQKIFHRELLCKLRALINCCQRRQAKLSL